MTLRNFRFELDADGICLLVWDMPGRSMNVLNEEVIGELEAVVDAVAKDAAVKGCVVTSGKESFSAGADLTVLETLGRTLETMTKTEGREKAMETFFERSRHSSLVYRKLETCGKPFACAINGVALGGGFELALACHYRVMADSDKVRVGLPEIKVGLFPGGGGTQRIARLMQTGDALQMLFKGDQIRPSAAKAMNLVHEVSPVAEVVTKAKAWILGGGKPIAPWDDKAFRLPSGKVYSPTGMMVWPPANAIYRRETMDNYPAAKAILHCVYEGLQLPMDLALKVESRYFAQILRSPVAAAMIRSLFVSMGEINKGARRPKNVPPSQIRKVGVIGAGFMGAGIAYISAKAGLDVVLLDKDQASADKGREHTNQLMTSQIMKGRATGAERDTLLARIKPSADYNDLAGCDLVIEAVFEDREVKAEATRKAQAVLGPETIFASNTSTLPITSLAEVADRPQDFIGLHFFSPVDRMMLVEIIMGQKTGDRALAVALDFVRLLKKTPIVVNDARGFFANRCVGSYIREGHLMLMEGVPPAMIENVAKMAGMPVGPLALNDEVALDLAWKVLQATKKDLGAQAIDPAQEDLLQAMVVKGGRLGRKNGKGFYDYPEKQPKRLWSGLAALQPKQLDPDDLDVAILKSRLLVVQALEAARTMEEGVVTDPREADVGSILGFGFAPFTGGALSYIDFMGVARFVALCEKLAKACGPRFAPSEALRKMAEKGETFYGRFDTRKAA
ncbi:MAG: enoyl-CoA hydratase/isomerase family protein [Hyphomicrobiales bacterium]|nr:enoyl-CoA hydratase/isomerase family protein [Hyphomicrobiales bacterium]MDE2113683.1 enoyl-CoA hydratase/isomerase family protein [Hyphomicrobiales bacterium]